jgi:hypothetical protein
MAGYRAGQDTAGMTAGLRVHLNRYRLDYAYAPYSDGLGATHRFGLGARW